MYLLGTQEAIDLISKDQERPIFSWIAQVRPGNNLFVSAISLGQAAHMVENLESDERPGWRRLLAEGQRKLDREGRILVVDLPVAGAWAGSLRGNPEFGDADPATGKPIPLGEDDRLVIATAIAWDYSLVTTRTPLLSRIEEVTTLTVVEPS